LDNLDKQILSVLNKHYIQDIYRQIVEFISDVVHIGQSLTLKLVYTIHQPLQTFGPHRGNSGSSKQAFNAYNTLTRRITKNLLWSNSLALGLTLEYGPGPSQAEHFHQADLLSFISYFKLVGLNLKQTYNAHFNPKRNKQEPS
jgi:hypothetical protein